MFEGEAFVVEGLPVTEYRCLASRLRYGPVEAPDSVPLVKFYDAGDQRFRYMTANKPPVAANGVITWTTPAGRWPCRPLTNDDQAWALLPGYGFDNFGDFKVWADSYSDAKVGVPSLF